MSNIPHIPDPDENLEESIKVLDTLTSTELEEIALWGEHQEDVSMLSANVLRVMVQVFRAHRRTTAGPPKSKKPTKKVEAEASLGNLLKSIKT